MTTDRQQRTQRIEPLFALAEELARDDAYRFAADGVPPARHIGGLLSEPEVRRRAMQLAQLPTEEYQALALDPVENSRRPGARVLIAALPGPVIRLIERGPLLAVEMDLRTPEGMRRVGIIAQERSVNHGAWSPEHHRLAAALVREFAQLKAPIITLIDTPGAEAGEAANLANQAHSISQLIAEIAQIDVPVIGIVIGAGYSGGAIPLATANVLLAVRDGIFNTIQPRGLASIARKQGLAWQDCARLVGVSACELCRQGYCDGVIDFVPGEDPAPFIRAVTTAIGAVERHVRHFAAQQPEFLDHYARSVNRFLDPSVKLRRVQGLSTLTYPDHPAAYMNYFGTVFRFARYLGLRRRLRLTTRERYAALAHDELPVVRTAQRGGGDGQAFARWLARPLAIRYDDELLAAWRVYTVKRHALGEQRGTLTRFMFGNPRQNYRRALRRLTLTYAFHLYNLWKSESRENFTQLIAWLREQPLGRAGESPDLTVTEVLCDAAVRDSVIGEAENLLLFDAVYEGVLANMPTLARAVLRDNVIPHAVLEELLARTLAAAGDGDPVRTEQRFFQWFDQLRQFSARTVWLRRVQAWKLPAHPRMASPLLTMATHIFAVLLPEYCAARAGERPYRGAINPRDIGMRDFWNRLVAAYQDLLISAVLEDGRRRYPVTAPAVCDRFFAAFSELFAELMTADPAHFPGFRVSLEQALAKGITPCGIITGIGTLRGEPGRRVGVVLSNSAFQAGAFDMASAEKFCRLLARCAQEGLPVVCFISSGGMQTKEGAGALFSMPLINDRLTRFIRDHELPVICFGYGDCTGGAQASFVTHPLVQTYYWSGTNMPFAGQVVVPAHLPRQATLSNYLSQVEGAMRGLVRHPFFAELDEQLRAIDPEIPVAQTTVEEVIGRVIRWDLLPVAAPGEDLPGEEQVPCRPFRRVLIHARGCAAVKLTAGAQAAGLEVVLVQSDADMRSVAAGMLRPERDRLVCLGGNTPAESYLNAMSVIRIAERTGAEALHPGIGFLSESPDFAGLVRRHGRVFVGPRVSSMELMGNKANAIATARALDIPVVPGSHGIVTAVTAAAEIAAAVGYPVLLKAVFGGGGKGIARAENERELRDKFATISAEALSAFGNGDMYLEKCVVSLRHIEVQLLRDSAGVTRVLGLRDCSVQRNNQKVIEESGSTMLPDRLRADALRWAAAIADRVEYLGAGTVEFIYDLAADALYFMEMNTRLQVEHPVTELTSGADIVGAQYAIAAGGSIAALQPRADGYAIELRINAERPTLTDGGLRFAPNAGTVTAYDFPDESGITVLSAVRAGSVVSPFYDSMLVQLIAHGSDRATVIDTLTRYLDRVRLEGVGTNLALLRAILGDDQYRGGTYDTAYLPGLLARLDAAALIAATERDAALAAVTGGRDRLVIGDSGELKVLAPRAGIFYRSPSPGEPDLVQEGATLALEQPLGLLEVMKTFTPLTLASYNAAGEECYPPGDYRVVSISASSGQQVNPGDLLMIVCPVAG
ncbi:MAG TPA: biotin carboxylase N-terminal domain-containing protein [bacterium]|nr:biotin carboxylase N-terminal domain-containing protein [bacterium]